MLGGPPIATVQLVADKSHPPLQTGTEKLYQFDVRFWTLLPNGLTTANLSVPAIPVPPIS